eukprot:gene14911-19737_t
MTYSVAFRWTAVTGGEDGLGGIKRLVVLRPRPLIGMAVVYGLWRFHRSPVGTVLVAIRENEQRARFLGYATDRYKLIAFTLSAALTGLAGSLLLFNNRMTSAEPISVAFSGEQLGGEIADMAGLDLGGVERGRGKAVVHRLGKGIGQVHALPAPHLREIALPPAQDIVRRGLANGRGGAACAAPTRSKIFPRTDTPPPRRVEQHDAACTARRKLRMADDLKQVTGKGGETHQQAAGGDVLTTNQGIP